MTRILAIQYFVLLLINVCQVYAKSTLKDIPILMPKAVSNRKDALVCHGYKFTSKKVQFIVKFEPHASKEVAHHLLLYGCPSPGTNQSFWNCGPGDPPVCKDGRRAEILYAWALDAPGKQLPKDVGLRVSGDTPIHSLIIQIHYVNPFKEGQTDSSGLTVTITEDEQKYQLGYFILGNWGYIPSMTYNYPMESACDWPNGFKIYPIAYRTHSHNLGVVTSGYRIRNGKWTEIGRMSPRQPQMFYNATVEGIDVRPGDVLAARCTMTNTRTEATAIGPTNRDEMCNFYIMFYTEQKGYIRVQYCFRDAQQFHWKEYLENIPDNASSLAGVSFIKNVDSSLFMGKG